MRSLCGDLYGTPACEVEWGDRATPCAEYGAAAMFAFAQKHDGASLNSALSAVMLGYHLPEAAARPLVAAIYSGSRAYGTTADEIDLYTYDLCMGGQLIR